MVVQARNGGALAALRSRLTKTSSACPSHRQTIASQFFDISFVPLPALPLCLRLCLCLRVCDCHCRRLCLCHQSRQRDLHVGRSSSSLSSTAAAHPSFQRLRCQFHSIADLFSSLTDCLAANCPRPRPRPPRRLPTETSGAQAHHQVRRPSLPPIYILSRSFVRRRRPVSRKSKSRLPTSRIRPCGNPPHGFCLCLCLCLFLHQHPICALRSASSSLIFACVLQFSVGSSGQLRALEILQALGHHTKTIFPSRGTRFTSHLQGSSPFPIVLGSLSESRA